MDARPPTPDAEMDRLARLRELLVLDSEPEPVFDSLARLASELCGTPIGLLTLVDADRQWFKANVGLPEVSQTPREVAFCAHAIEGEVVFEVRDAASDARFAGNPLVTGSPEIRFYAGAPLTLPGGARVGTLCVIDREPRQLDAAQTHMLRSLADIACQALLMRRDMLQKAMQARSRYEQALALSEAQYRTIVEEQSELISLARLDGTLLYVNPAYARHFGRTPAAMVGASLYDFVQAQDVDAVRQQIEGALEGGPSISSENRMRSSDGCEHWVAWTNGRQIDARGDVLLHSVGRDITQRRQAEQALRASQAFLARTGRVAGVGGWQLELASGMLTWSEETRRIHEVGPDYVPTLDAAIDFYAPEARPVVEAAVQAGMQSGKGWDLQLPLITAAGRRIWARAVGEVEFEGGKPVRLVGAFQDITERTAVERRLRELTAILDNSTDFVVQTDWRGQVIYMNPAVRSAVGLTAQETVSERHFSEFNTPATHRHFSEVIVPAVKADGVWLGQTSVFLSGQREVPVSHLVIGHREADGRIGRYSAVMRDISAAVQDRQQLQRQSATLRSVTEAIATMVGVVGTDGCYRFVNSAFARWIGLPPDGIIGRHAREILGADEFEHRQVWIERAMAGETVSFERIYPERETGRHLLVSYVPLRLDNGQVDGFVVINDDITQHQHEKGQLRQLAQRDTLTGLLNRAGFESTLQRQLDEGGAGALALLYIDLDRFKPVNDEHGHMVGDQVLMGFAQRLLALVRPTDAVARLGGDEFAILLAGVRSSANARGVADKVIAAAAIPFELGCLQLRIGASVGVAYGIDASVGLHDLAARADSQLYEAKRAGRGRQAGADAQYRFALNRPA